MGFDRLRLTDELEHLVPGHCGVRIDQAEIDGVLALLEPLHDVALTGTNLFNAKGFLDINQASMPTTGIGWARSVQGRTLAASVRFNF